VDFEPLEAARRVLQKRRLLPPPAGSASAALAPKERARAARLLLGRGFSEDVVSALLGQGALDPPDPSD
jgi:regulatory protein